MHRAPAQLCGGQGRRSVSRGAAAVAIGVMGWMPSWSTRCGTYARLHTKRGAALGARTQVPLGHRRLATAPQVPARRQTKAWQPGVFSVPPAVSVPLHIPRPSYADHPRGIPRPLRPEEFGEAKSAAAIAGMRGACRLAAEALVLACETAREGVSTDDVDRVVSEFVIARGAYPVGINYHGFPRGLCSSPNEVVLHGIPNTRALESGDIVNFDVTVYLDGFFGDCSAMVSIGEIDAHAAKLVQTTEECLYKAIDYVGPGVSLNSIGTLCNSFARSRGFSVVEEFCGHFIGSELHMKPNVAHVPNGETLELRPGMTFTIEPILMEGAPQIEVCEDGWTYVSRSGGWSAQWEHTVLVTENGAEVLTTV